MCANSGGEPHCVTHETAHAAVAVWKRVNEVEPVMGRCNGHDPARFAHTGKPVTALEMMHEGINAFARRRQVTADGDIVLRT